MSMSTDPTGLGAAENPSLATSKHYINLRLTRKDWCAYKWKCKITQCLYPDDLCFHCKYHKLLDIPQLLTINQHIDKEKKSESS
jgi:hypothetical protein